MKISKFNLSVNIILAVAPLIALGILYKSLPNEIPMHWNLAGEIDRYGSKGEIFLIALIPIAMWLLLFALPKLDPKKKNYEKFGAFYNAFTTVMILFFDLIFAVTVISSYNPDLVSVYLIIPISVGLLFIFIGNFMPKIKQNFYFGVKTAWTLSSETVWNKTHRLAGYCFIISGIMIAISAFLPTNLVLIVFITAILVGALVPVVMSYIYFKKEQES